MSALACKNTIPRLVFASSGSEVSEVEVPVGSYIELRYLGRRFCSRFVRGRYCLNPLTRVRTEALPWCDRCLNEIPSIKCVLGDPQCSEEEAPKSRKCVNSGIFEERCRVPRYHYVLIYPISPTSVYLKVGINRETTFPTRVLEQGAPIAVVYAKTPNVWKGRVLELSSREVLRKLEGRSIAEGIRIAHASEVKKTLSVVSTSLKYLGLQTYSLDTFLLGGTETSNLLDKLVNVGKAVCKYLVEQFREFALENPLVLNLWSNVYPIDRSKLSGNFVAVDSVEKISSLEGEVVGWAGSVMLLRCGGTLYLLNFHRFSGSLLRLRITQ